MKFKVGVVGLGKLGTPLALLIAKAGHTVHGVDLNPNRIMELNSRDVFDTEPGVSELLRDSSLKIHFSSKYDELNLVEVIYVIVPTPSLDSGLFSNEFVISALENIGLAIAKNTNEQLIVIVSTVMPGSTDGVLLKALMSNIDEKNRNKKRIIYSPEFIALGSVIHNLRFPDIILVGASREEDAKVHLEITKSLAMNSPEEKVLSKQEAELVKLAINTFITMKITFANFIGEIARKSQEVDATIVCDAIGRDTRIGAKYLSPGLGFGGPCFPRDNRAFSEYAKSLNLNAELAIATERINKSLPESISSWIISSYPEKRKIAILGITYKENSDVIEESQSIYLANELSQKGWMIMVHDPLLRVKPDTLDDEIEFSNELDDIYSCDLAIRTINWSPYEDIDTKRVDVIKMR
jgi:UDPglucose 6-dehydrogenase